MIAFLWDENASHLPLKAMRQRHPTVRAVAAQEVGLGGAPDDLLLDWAVANDCVVVTQDLPLIGLARTRRLSGEPIRLIVIGRDVASASAIADDLALIAIAAVPGDWTDVLFVPL